LDGGQQGIFLPGSIASSLFYFILEKDDWTLISSSVIRIVNPMGLPLKTKQERTQLAI
jgi:hypothetical protein